MAKDLIRRCVNKNMEQSERKALWITPVWNWGQGVTRFFEIERHSTGPYRKGREAVQKGQMLILQSKSLFKDYSQHFSPENITQYSLGCFSFSQIQRNPFVWMCHLQRTFVTKMDVPQHSNINLANHQGIVEELWILKFDGLYLSSVKASLPGCWCCLWKGRVEMEFNTSLEVYCLEGNWEYLESHSEWRATKMRFLTACWPNTFGWAFWVLSSKWGSTFQNFQKGGTFQLFFFMSWFDQWFC